MSARLPDPGTVRGEITREILKYRHLLVPPVLEVGALRPPAAWWRDMRTQFGYTPDEWVGTDIEAGTGVDVVANLCSWMCRLPAHTYGSVLCAETLEHVADPRLVLLNLRHSMLSGAWIIVTMPFAFAIHDYPDDYWRFAPSGMEMMLEDAGFVDVEAHGFNEFLMVLKDHDNSAPAADRWVPMHVLGRGRRP